MTHDPGNRVAVAFSGGLDSTAAAIILKQKGYDVLALTMLLPLKAGQAESSVEPCRALADRLGVEHEAVDMRGPFDRMVIRPFLEAYRSGLTPNPCITCNKRLKFGLLLEHARKRGCGLMATGHYARLSTEKKGQVTDEPGSAGEEFTLFRGRDRAKDQSYVLWTLDQAKLSHVLLPLGELTREDCKSIVTGAGVRDLVQPESQDICFLSGRSYRSLIAETDPGAARPGPVLDHESTVLGTHKGLPFYTVGQRHGLGIASHQALYVLELRPAENALVVGGIEHRSCRQFEVEGTSFVSGNKPPGSITCEVATRYRGPPLPARLTILPHDRGSVGYVEPGPPSAPGQSAVFYEGDRLLGGAFISRPVRVPHNPTPLDDNRL